MKQKVTERRREGDIVVTAVVGHYAIGRLKAERDMQDSLGSAETLAEALEQACALAGATHRIFLSLRASAPGGYLPADCAEVSR
jgi:hypothetical protein